MTQYQLYKYGAIGLLIINILMISFFFITRPSAPPMPMGHGTNAVDILHLSESQNQEFLTLAKSHQQLMRELDGEKRELLKQYFATLNTKDEASSEALLSHIKEIEGQKTKKTFQHLEEVKSILNEDQKAIFPEFMDQVLQIILGNQHKNPAPPKDF